MNLFFESSFKYEVEVPKNVIVSEIQSIVNAKWYDFSKNLYGSIDETASFHLKRKISVGPYSRGINLTAEIKGKVTSSGNSSIIIITCSASAGIIMLFCLSSVSTLLVAGLMIFSWDAPSELLSTAFGLLMASLILFAAGNAMIDSLVTLFEEGLNLEC